jgi:Caspase domain
MHIFKSHRLKISRAILFVILVLISGYGLSQGIYEIKYQFYDKTVNGKSVLGDPYRALLFYHGPNAVNNVVRVRFYDKTDGWVVVEQKIKVKIDHVNGKDSWVLSGESPQYITKVPPGRNYYPDLFSLSKNALDIYYKPDYVFSKDDQHPFLYGVINSFVPLSNSTVDNAYLADFEWEWPAKNNIPTIDFTRSTLHLVLVSNSNDARLGMGFMANHRKLKSLFTDIAGSCNLNLDLVEVSGDNFRRSNILSAVSNLYTAPNDIIIFYYSGHGFRYPDQQSGWPRMDLRANAFKDFVDTNSLSIDTDVYQPLKRKGARLTIVIGECCNTVPEAEPISADPMLIAPGENILSADKAKSLMNKKGDILIATSSPNEPSVYYVSIGGFFCNNFVTSLLSNLGFNSSATDITWENIFNLAKQGTELEALMSGKKQNPYWHIAMQ